MYRTPAHRLVVAARQSRKALDGTSKTVARSGSSAKATRTPMAAVSRPARSGSRSGSIAATRVLGASARSFSSSPFGLVNATVRRGFATSTRPPLAMRATKPTKAPTKTVVMEQAARPMYRTPAQRLVAAARQARDAEAGIEKPACSGSATAPVKSPQALAGTGGLGRPSPVVMHPKGPRYFSTLLLV